MTKPPINFNAIKNLRELHQILKSRKINLEVECSMDEIGEPITFVRNHEIKQSSLTEQVLRFLRRSSVVKFNRKLNSKSVFKNTNFLQEYEEEKEYHRLLMLDQKDIKAGIAKVYKKVKNNHDIINELYLTLDLLIPISKSNKAFEEYIKPNFTQNQIETSVNEIRKNNMIDDLEFDETLRPQLVQYLIEEGKSLKDVVSHCGSYPIKTNFYGGEAHKILMKPIIKFLLEHFKELEVWKISNDTTYFVIGRIYFFVGIFGYTHDGQFDGVVYRGIIE